jgi:UDP-2-acetamido-3-amino-2,3-dideoxy-glucuronate N-acetyltransferase
MCRSGIDSGGRQQRRSAGSIERRGEVMARIQPSADVSDQAQIGEGTSIWHLAQVRENAVLGENCIIGRGAYVGPGVVMGDNCKLQNYALVYEPARLADGVFVGPAVVFTNDHYPRAITADGKLKRGDDWEMVAVTVGEGASIGARSVCVAPVTIGSWALVAAGSVVVKDVPDFALVAGVPARRLRWVGHEGVPLEPDGGDYWRCPKSGRRYLQTRSETPGADGADDATLTEVPQS